MNSRQLLFWLVVALNVIAFFYGTVFYYWQQLLESSPLLWVFIIDCPLYSLLFALTLLLVRIGKQNHALYFISFVGALKYGFWTVFVLAAFSGYYFTPEYSLTYALLFAAHFFLFLEASLLLGKIQLKRFFIVIALAWFLLNDAVDYLLGTHPSLPSQQIQFMFVFTAMASILFTAVAFAALKRFKKPLIDVF